jgi:16S rRNA (guanine966-N2)-methyltransferase
MRVIAGQWRGRRIETPRGRATRPTSDRVREALFSALHSRLGGCEGLRVGDLYAGSGALGIEALSRGAAHVTFVESDRRAVAVIRRNLDSLDVTPTRVDVLPVDVSSAAGHRAWGAPVALLFADPPYRIGKAQVAEVLTQYVLDGAISPGATVVYEHDARDEADWPPGFIGVDERRYGDTGISIATFGG